MCPFPMSLLRKKRNTKKPPKKAQSMTEKWQLNNRRVIRQKIYTTVSIVYYTLLIDCSFSYKSMLT